MFKTIRAGIVFCLVREINDSIFIRKKNGKSWASTLYFHNKDEPLFWNQ